MEGAVEKEAEGRPQKNYRVSEEKMRTRRIRQQRSGKTSDGRVHLEAVAKQRQLKAELC